MSNENKNLFFVLTLGLCNLIKGIPSLEEIIEEIINCNFFDRSKINIICRISSDKSGFCFWNNSFSQVLNPGLKDIKGETQVKLLFLLLALGILQVDANDKQLIHAIKRELDVLIIFNDNELKQSGLNITRKELINEFNKRVSKEDRILLEAKKRKLEPMTSSEGTSKKVKNS